MQTPVDAPLDKVRCAPFHDSLAVSPAGTATHADAFLCVEVPLPWERDIGSHEPFASLAVDPGSRQPEPQPLALQPPAPQAPGPPLQWRFQGLVPSAGSDPQRRRVLAFSPAQRTDASDGVPTIGSLRRREWLVPADELHPLCRAVLDRDEERLSTFVGSEVSRRRGSLDLLVCTHGTRDVCCGSAGTALHDQVVRPSSPGEADSAVRVWRTSHTGGHRFAPTAISFPDGYAWAHLGAAELEAVLARSAPPSSFAANCRGVSTLPTGPAQVADLAALATVGWRWLDATRSATVTAFERVDMTTTVQVSASFPDGTDATFRATVSLDRHVPQPTCGLIDGPEYKVEPVWSLRSFETIHAEVTL